jgi:hypothetical protein
MSSDGLDAFRVARIKNDSEWIAMRQMSLCEPLAMPTVKSERET